MRRCASAHAHVRGLSKNAVDLAIPNRYSTLVIKPQVTAESSPHERIEALVDRFFPTDLRKRLGLNETETALVAEMARVNARFGAWSCTAIGAWLAKRGSTSDNPPNVAQVYISKIRSLIGKDAILTVRRKHGETAYRLRDDLMERIGAWRRALIEGAF